MAKYQIDNTTMLTDSGGRSLISPTVKYEGSFTATNTLKTLSPTYFAAFNPPSNPYQGNGSGYYSGGGPPQTTAILKYPFVTDGGAALVGNLTAMMSSTAGALSTTEGFYGGGTPGPSPTTTIQKFPFASDGNASNVGTLSVGTRSAVGNSSDTHGYTAGGFRLPPASNIIDKYPFAISSGTATDVGDLTNNVYGGAGSSSPVGGFVAGGGPTPNNVINKFSFASDGNATSVGTISSGVMASDTGIVGQSSDTHGYAGGGPGSNIIHKFPFAMTSGSSTDVGDLTVERGNASGTSSFESGYTAGGSTPSGDVNTIDKFPFSTDANATDVGDLAISKANAGTVEVQSGRQ